MKKTKKYKALDWRIIRWTKHVSDGQSKLTELVLNNKLSLNKFKQSWECRLLRKKYICNRRANLCSCKVQ